METHNKNILNKIDEQIQFFSYRLKRDIDRKKIIYDYYIRKNTYELLDWIELKNFLTFNKFEKLIYLKEIFLRANNLIDFYNDFDEKEIERFEKPYILKGSLNGFTSDKFRLALITKNEIRELSNNRRYVSENLAKYTFEIITLEQIAHKCLNIIEVIYSFYPEVTENKDISDFSNFTIENAKGTEKIVMLYKLGIIDFLKNKEPFNTSTNSLASVVSTFTGIKQTHVYPMLQTIINPNNNQKNNPLNTKKTVSKIEQTLNSIGFKVSSTDL